MDTNLGVAAPVHSPAPERTEAVVSGWPMQALFALALSLGAFLVFLVQPMVGKMMLPYYGGAANVWCACLVFFQSVLLAAYAYAHWTRRWLGVRRQAWLHLALLVVAAVFLPFRMSDDWSPSSDSSPVATLLILLTASVGLPVFVVSATAPLLQSWFAATRHRAAGDPYYLYAASNAGSLLALLAYPAAVEPWLHLPWQTILWATGFGLLGGCILACAVMLWRSPASTVATVEGDAAVPSTFDRFGWFALALVPSSLLLGTTQYLTINIAPVPLLWVVPLALYLISFILGFSRLPVAVVRTATIAFGCFCLIMLGVDLGKWAGVAVHLLLLFSAALMCHAELARRRPGPGRLTEFYLWIALGGVCGSLFNTVAAPLLFVNRVEYPLMIVAALLLAATFGLHRRWSWLDAAAPAALAVVAVVLFFAIPALPLAWKLGLSALLAVPFVVRPARLGLAVAALFLCQWGYQQATSRLETLYQERNFFGSMRVAVNPQTHAHWLIHGNVEHGAQLMSAEQNKRRVPLLYFDITGPIGEVFLQRMKDRIHTPVAVVGLGAGTLAAYGLPGQEFKFFEIDPAVVRIAENPHYFTFLSESRAKVDVVVGDARLALAHEPDDHYGMLIVDAFNGDAIPAHLLTREAIGLYLSKLKPDGVLAFHISNNYLDLEHVLAGEARAWNLVGVSRKELPQDLTAEERKRSKYASHWAVMARTSAPIAKLMSDPRWRSLADDPRPVVWTDDFSSLLPILRWR